MCCFCFTKMHPPKNKILNSKNISYQSSSLVSVVSRIFIFIDIFTHAPYLNHTQNTPYVVVFSVLVVVAFKCFLFQCRIFIRCRWRSWIWRESCQTKATQLRSPGHWLWFRITGNHIHINDFAYIPWEIPQIFPKTSIKQTNLSENIGEGVRSIFFKGYVGEILKHKFCLGLLRLSD